MCLCMRIRVCLQSRRKGGAARAVRLLSEKQAPQEQAAAAAAAKAAEAQEAAARAARESEAKAQREMLVQEVEGVLRRWARVKGGLEG